MTQAAKELEEKIHSRRARLGVIGLGYVGLPLAVEMAKAGFQVTGIDVDEKKVDSVNNGGSYILDVSSDTLRDLVSEKKIRASQSMEVLQELDTVSICVPTPLRKTRDPDLSFIMSAVAGVRYHLHPGQLVVLESTTFPSTTRDVVLPIVTGRSNLEVGKDFFLAYSPERVDPGNQVYATRNIPKVIGGMTPCCTELAVALYQQFIERIIPVSSPDTAEMVKLVENTFRSVNIALANEMAVMCQKFGINVWEVIEAASTKPFGFMPFYPGPGLGGHCIPVDPYFLTWKARMNGSEPRLIELAGQINSEMPEYTISRIADALNDKEKSLKGAKVLGLGVAYKRDTNDLRESPAIEVLEGLHKKGSVVSYSDPHIPMIELNGKVFQSVHLEPDALQSVDCVVVLTDHSAFDYKAVAAYSPLVLDTRNALKDFSGSNLIRF